MGVLVYAVAEEYEAEEKGDEEERDGTEQGGKGPCVGDNEHGGNGRLLACFGHVLEQLEL